MGGFANEANTGSPSAQHWPQRQASHEQQSLGRRNTAEPLSLRRDQEGTVWSHMHRPSRSSGATTAGGPSRGCSDKPEETQREWGWEKAGIHKKPFDNFTLKATAGYRLLKERLKHG